MLQAAVHALDNSTLYQKCTQVGIIRKPIAGGDGSVPSSAKTALAHHKHHPRTRTGNNIGVKQWASGPVGRGVEREGVSDNSPSLGGVSSQLSPFGCQNTTTLKLGLVEQ
jgi:hypothetical protein